MLPFDKLSFWERRAFLENIDFLIVGAGIVGSACALSLRKKHPSAKILIVERGYLPSGASTKNAGFACFGSVTELLDDLSHLDEGTVWDTLELRFNGLNRLRERFTDEEISLKFRGSWDLIDDSDQRLPDMLARLEYLNKKTFERTGIDNCYSFDAGIAKKCGFKGISGGFFSRAEGELETDKLFLATQRKLAENNILQLCGIEVKTYQSGENVVTVESNYGELKASNLIFAVNGFGRQLLGEKRIQPARAQVIVSEKIPGFTLPGTFHYQEGYYYFREIDNRLFIGGGRNLDKAGETTETLENTELITNAIKSLVFEKIIPGKTIQWEYQWAGIMGVGSEKKPIVELIDSNVAAGIRLGGMGVAIGSLVGEQLAELFV